MTLTKPNKILIYGLIVLLAIGASIFFALDFIVEYWWFGTLDYSAYFLRREGYLALIVGSIFLLISTLIYSNFSLITQNIKCTASQDEATIENSWFRRLFTKRSLLKFLPLSMLFTLPILIPVALNWDSFLLFFFQVKSGIEEPIFGKDISFYLFSYPVYKLIYLELIATFSLILLATAFFYWNCYKKIKDKTSKSSNFPVAGKIHLSCLIAILVCIQVWAIYLDRAGLVYESRHEPIFSGPGFVEMNYSLPLIWLTFFAFLSVAISSVYYIFQKKGSKVIASFSIVFIAMIGLRNTSFLPDIVERFYVQPSPVKTEGKYIKNNIDATLHAFDLDNIERIEYPVSSSLDPQVSVKISENLRNIPLWDQDLLDDVFNQLQSIRPFFNFPAVSVDRYQLDNQIHQVNVATRELLFEQLPEGAQTWQNKHLVYTHGFGAVITPSQQTPNQPPQWLLKNLSLTTEHERLRLDRPEIFYGRADYSYVFVPNDAEINFLQTPNSQPNEDYQGTGGLKMSSLLKKMMMAAYLQDQTLFFSRIVSDQSKALIRRNIFQRVKEITPFLQVESSPHPVIANHKLYWIMDGFTTSSRYPAVKPVPSPYYQSDSPSDNEEMINYIRNSVTIVIDAYNGTVDYYIVDEQDPIIASYKRAYPTLFKNKSEMPVALVGQQNYPQQLLNLQMQIYSRYHQTDPEIFYKQSDTLEIAKDQGQAIAPYYLMIDSIDKPSDIEAETQGFLLLSPLSPVGRDNLRLLALAGCFGIEKCNSDYSDSIKIFDFPTDIQVTGPAQINAIIDQTPEISQQLTLWDQRGSSVIRGRLIIMPVEDTLLYIQPIYLKASAATRFPQLVRVVVVLGKQAVMDTSIKAAFEQLQKK